MTSDNVYADLNKKNKAIEAYSTALSYLKE